MKYLAFTFCAVFLFFGMVAKAQAATIYVKSDAGGAANGTSWTDAYTTIQAAVTAVSTGDVIEIWNGTYAENLVIGTTQNGKSFTINGGNGGDVILTKSSGIVMNIQSQYTSGNITISNMTIYGTGTVTSQITVAGSPQLIFSNSTLGNSSDVGVLISLTSTSNGSISINNCTTIHNANSYGVDWIGSTNITFSGGTITSGGNASFIVVDGTQTSDATLTVSGVDIDITGKSVTYGLFGWGYLQTGAVTVTGNTIATVGNGIIINWGAPTYTITNNVITNTATSGTGPGITVGKDGSSAYAAVYGTPTITDNTINFNGTAVSHGIVSGKGLKSGTIARNIVTNANYGLVVKSDGVNIYGNIFTTHVSDGLGGVFFRGGIGNSIVNNTFYLRTKYGLQFDTQDGVDSENADSASQNTRTTISLQQLFSSISEGGTLTVKSADAQPGAEFRVRISINNPSGGPLNLYEGVTTFAVAGIYNSSPVSENITFTSSAGNKAIAAGQYRTKSSTQLFDSVTSVTVTNKPDGALKVDAGSAGIHPYGNIVKNNIFYQISGNGNVMINDLTGYGRGDAGNNDIDYNIYSLGTGASIASLNYGGTPPTVLATLANLQAGWITYNGVYQNNDAHSITADPLFVSASDYHLQSTSPAIDVGTDVGLTSDYAEVSIPRGNGYEIGAYEYPVPISSTIGTPQVQSTTSIRWNFTDNASDETGFKVYDGTDTLITSLATADLTYLDETGLSENTQYSGRYITAYNSYGDSVHSSTATATYTLAGIPTNLSSLSSQNNIILTVDSLPNDTSGQSGYYFSNSTNSTNSGWIQTNTWTETELSCGDTYTYSVKYRNGDGVETDPISITATTTKCNSSGSRATKKVIIPATPAPVVTPNPSPSSGPSIYNFGTTTLRNGSRGEAVKELQRFLNAKLNLGLVVDGIFGPKTLAIVKQWQKDNGLVVDGLVGPLTKAKMNAN